MPQPPAKRKKLTPKQLGDSARKYDSLASNKKKEVSEEMQKSSRLYESRRSLPPGATRAKVKKAELNALNSAGAASILAGEYGKKAKDFRSDSTKASKPPKKRK